MLSSVYGVKKQKARIFAGFSDLQNWVSGVLFTEKRSTGGGGSGLGHLRSALTGRGLRPSEVSLRSEKTKPVER